MPGRGPSGPACHCLTGSLQGRRDGSVLADCVGGEDETEGGSRSEEGETGARGLPHVPGPSRWLAPVGGGRDSGSEAGRTHMRCIRVRAWSTVVWVRVSSE